MLRVQVRAVLRRQRDIGRTLRGPVRGTMFAWHSVLLLGVVVVVVVVTTPREESSAPSSTAGIQVIVRATTARSTTTRTQSRPKGLIVPRSRAEGSRNPIR